MTATTDTQNLAHLAHLLDYCAAGEYGLSTDECREAAALLRQQEAEIARLTADAIHSCWHECPRPLCVAQREIARLTALTTCGCGDQFTAHDPGTCGACVAGMTCSSDDELDTAPQTVQAAPYQSRVQPWLLACFGAEIAADKVERNHRFTEEALELVQALGMPAADAHALVEYVYSRPAGEPGQEVGGVMTTLAALCLANGLDMHAEAETELARIWTKVDAIRAKQAAKPKGSALSIAWAVQAAQESVAWLYTCKRAPSGGTMVYASVDENDTQHWPITQWREVIKTPLIAAPQPTQPAEGQQP